MAKETPHFISIVPVILLGLFMSLPDQRALDDVVVTGEVTNIGLCHREADASVYKLTIKLQARNVGTEPVIVSSADAMTDFYRIADSIDGLGSKSYAHIGWVTSRPGDDPKSVPSKPVKPFKIVSPKAAISIHLDVRIVVIGELKPGRTYIELIAENWPHYSDDYVSKITQAWRPHGILWAHSLHTKPIVLIVPSAVKQIVCP